MARAGGGGRSGGFGSSGTSGGSSGGSRGGIFHTIYPRVNEAAPFVDVAPPMAFVGGTPRRHIRILSLLIALLWAFGVFGCTFFLVSGTGGEKIDGVVYDEEIFEEYADKRYKDAFGGFEGVEDNILIVFLANRNADEFYCITWVGENLNTEIVKLFGDKTTDFGITTMATVSGSYESSLDESFVSIIEHMTMSVASLGLDSPFITDFGFSARSDSHFVNDTELDIDKYAVSDALEAFTNKNGVPIVISLDYMDNVFKKPYQQISTALAAAFMLVAVTVTTCIISVSIKKAKRHIKKDDSKYGKDYDRSRYNKRI